MSSDLSTKDILDRMDAIEARQSAQLASARSENRYMMLAMLFVIAALAGVQITGFGFSAKPSATATINMSSSEAVEASEPSQSSVNPADNTPPEKKPFVDPVIED